MNATSTFISYSWDSDLHKTWVRALAEQVGLAIENLLEKVDCGLVVADQFGDEKSGAELADHRLGSCGGTDSADYLGSPGKVGAGHVSIIPQLNPLLPRLVGTWRAG